jgi:fatty acid desaturase
VAASTIAVTMLPAAELLVAPDPSARVTSAGRPVPEWREELRRIPSWRNAGTVVFLYAQTLAVLTAVVLWGGFTGLGALVWVAAFLLIGRAHAQYAILGHEAAHRLLFANRRANDVVGRYLLAYPSFVPFDAYRRSHMAHHREEFGPNEPDIPLYRGYPIGRDSFRRKLTRDALGITGWKLLKGLFRGLRAPNGDLRRQAWSILGAQVVLLGLFVLAGHPWMYLFFWFLPYLTVWRVINRLRAIAEHGGMTRSPDRRLTTHAVRQSRTARFWIVPYNTGWHLAHHVDSGIPWRALPRHHAELVASGYVQPGLEYPNYRALWRKLASGSTEHPS